MEKRSTQSLSSIPTTLIRVVFNLHVSNLLCKLYCKYSYRFILLFSCLLSVDFSLANFHLPTYQTNLSIQMNLPKSSMVHLKSNKRKLVTLPLINALCSAIHWTACSKIGFKRMDTHF